MTFQRRWAGVLMTFILVCLLAVLLIVLNQSRGTAAAVASPGTITVIDLLGRQVQVRVPVQRVILGEGRMLYIVAALDTENPIERIVSWRKDLIQADPDTYALYRQKFPKIADIPTFGGFEDGAFEIEQAITLEPDVIFLNIEAQRATDDARYIEKLAALGIPVVYVDFRHAPMENTEATLRLFGELFGKEVRAEQLIAYRSKEMRRVTDVIAARQPERPKVFIERIGGYTTDCCLSFGDENFGKFVELAGGRNIAKNSIPGTFGQLNPEQIIAANPSHVIITSANWEAYVPGGNWIGVGPGADPDEAVRKLALYTKRSAYTDITANKEHAFHAVWHQFYNNPYQFVAIQQFAKWLHPELFVDLDPEASFRELHERFLPITYQPGYFATLDRKGQ